MWSMIKNATETADIFTIWFSVASAAFAFSAWWKLTFGPRRRHKKYMDAIKKSPGQRPGILIVDLLRGERSIESDVLNYMKASEALTSIDSKHVFKIQGTKESLTANDMPWFNDELRKASIDVLNAGIGTLHLFYAGPVIPAAIVGREFGNSRQVILYQRSKDKTSYEPWGALRTD